MSDKEKLGSRGIEFTAAHFPGRAPVDSYGNGGFRFADMSHKGSILCLPSGIYGWIAKHPNELIIENFQRVFGETGLELVLIGTGTNAVPLSLELREKFSEVGLRADPMNTGAAARTFNVLLAEGRAVGAALLAVD